tara:strand:+ start:1092 stop:1943 length:852 start_codon:yes stop_codon:yes gene_type:complete
MNKFENLHECFLSELQAITHFGNYVNSNGTSQTELLFRSMCIKDPTKLSISIPARKFNENYSLMEFLWYLSGNRKTNNIGKCANIWLKIKDDQNEVESNYGSYILGQQWDWILNELTSDRDSRRATIVIHQPHHKTKNESDLPCTQYIQFFIRDNKLHMGVNMRSNDIIFGFCNDVYTFSLFQQLMLNDLNEFISEHCTDTEKVELGHYYHQAGSLHLYDMHYDMRDEILRQASHPIDEKVAKMKAGITTNYIKQTQCFLPDVDMTKPELVEFTNSKIKEMFE